MKDQAGNSTNQYVNTDTPVDGTVTELATDGLSDFFVLDSKPPKVKINISQAECAPIAIASRR